MKKEKLLKQVIDAVVKHELTGGLPLIDVIDYYSQVIDTPGRFYYIEEDGELLAFVDGFNLEQEPYSLQEALLLFAKNPNNNGKIHVVINAVNVKGEGNFREVMREAEKDHPDWEYLMWYSIKHDRFVKMKSRREPCRETAE